MFSFVSDSHHTHMQPNVLIVPVLGLDHSGISTILESIRNISPQVASWTIRTVVEEPVTDYQLGDLRVMQQRHPQFSTEVSL